MLCPSLRMLAVPSYPLQEATGILQSSVLLIHMPVKVDVWSKYCGKTESDKLEVSKSFEQMTLFLQSLV